MAILTGGLFTEYIGHWPSYCQAGNQANGLVKSEPAKGDKSGVD